jgi:hypothetical protein
VPAALARGARLAEVQLAEPRYMIRALPHAAALTKAEVTLMHGCFAAVYVPADYFWFDFYSQDHWASSTRTAMM